MTRVLTLPCDNEDQWRRHLELFSHISNCKDVTSLQTLLEEIAAVANPKANQVFQISGLQVFFKHFATLEESERFFESTLPFIASLAARLKQELSGDAASIPLLQSGHEQSISLKRSLVACLLACGVLCVFPAQSGVGALNFVRFYKCFNNNELNRRKSQSAKFQCVIHYFDRLKECGLENISGHVIYNRRVLSDIPTLQWWTENSLPLCPVEVYENGSIENSGEETMQVDFAARHVGGGILATGRVQEEIRFCINPELIASMLFTEAMEPHEAVTIRGTERFSSYAGYGQTLQFAGNYQDESKCDDNGDLLTTIVAIDAVNVNNLQGTTQYSLTVITRELMKAYAGFSSPQPDLANVSLPSTDAHSHTVSQEILQFSDQLVDDIMTEVKCEITAAEQSGKTFPCPMRSLSQFADRQVAAIFQSVREVFESTPSAPSSVDEFSSSLVAGIVKSAPEAAFIEQLRTPGSVSVELLKQIPNGNTKTLHEWAHQLVMTIIQSAIDKIQPAYGQSANHITQQAQTGRYRSVATGNWGCGAFGGDPQLKSLIQWMAVSAAGRPAMKYYLYGDKRAAQLKEVTRHVTCNSWNIGDMMNALTEYSQCYYSDKKTSKQPRPTDLFNFILTH